MTVHDDLATLRYESERMSLALIELGDEDVHEAHAAVCDLSRRVEAEIARLEERANFADAYAYRQRAEAAEADNARLRDRLRLRPSRKEELVAGMVALADDLEAGRIFLQDFPADMRKRLRRALLADQDGAATCAKCRHAAHGPGACEVNVGTGYHGPVPCRCGADQDGAA